MHPKRLILWIIWSAITIGLCMIYVFLGQGTAGAHSKDLGIMRVIPMVPLALALLVRFLLIPKFKSLTKVLPLFIIGLSMAEGSGIIAIFLLPHADAVNYFTTAVIVLLMYDPLFANQLEVD
jgi:hypothetical protein